MGISIGLVGLGSFGGAFAPLFKNHPLVDRIGLCDVEPDRIQQYLDDPFFADKISEKDCYDSLDAICKADFDALVIITQPWLHAPQCIQTMENGKHVYSAVPIISVPDNEEVLDWCVKIIECVQRTGMHYMLGETTYYRPQAQFCRRMAAQSLFGDYIYAEGEYFHDVDSKNSNLRLVDHRRSLSKPGQEWQKTRANYARNQKLDTPMFYPTHSCGGPVCVMGSRAVKVSAYGSPNRNNDPYFAHSKYSNIAALYQMENGSTVRICEMRETPGSPGRDSETFRIFGSLGSFSENNWWEAKRPDFEAIELDNLPKPTHRHFQDAELFDKLPEEVEKAFKQVDHRELDDAALSDTDFVPRGHGGSHPYLVHEFVSAVAENRLPAIHIWEAARYMAMGVAANLSAERDGELVEVPDFGWCK